ncbi:Pro-kumamolisin, activation domain-containing protein [Suillus plorans]|uniref:Pro-kumamolisin, activation domain-containing protein n=1 Tax=Suillus plorans TaxID=116603 RepID=A0A9P7AJR9_9AGAM|nr:Pro-kumamolisin, activation domain-containing protein [Suillus plorans]KAG1790900.1 Pro-kumamolisin, activation domain-containing protein [Suillus plorans]
MNTQQITRIVTSIEHSDGQKMNVRQVIEISTSHHRKMTNQMTDLSPYNVHEERSAIPIGWSHTRRHESAATLPPRIALKQSNIESIDEYLYDVSHPKSANYDKHWTAGEIARKFSPSEESISAVRN